MKKIIIISLSAGALLFTGCSGDQTETATNAITETQNTTLDRTETSASGGMETAIPDSVYRQEAVVITERMAEDLKLDSEAQAIAEEIFYNRAKRRDAVQNEFEDNEYRLNKEMVTIEEETDQQVLSILTYSQSKEYVENRDTYEVSDTANVDINTTATDRSGGMSQEMDKNK